MLDVVGICVSGCCFEAVFSRQVSATMAILVDGRVLRRATFFSGILSDAFWDFFPHCLWSGVATKRKRKRTSAGGKGQKSRRRRRKGKEKKTSIGGKEQKSRRR